MKTLALDESTLAILDRLNTHGKEAFVVGGFVRDALMDIPSHDVDITTNALPEEIVSLFADWTVVPTGLKHGTVTLVDHEHHPYECTTYRVDGQTKDHRHPEEVTYTQSLQEDCARRDFTMNAICYHPNLGLVDFYEGQKDIENRLVRCIGDPNTRFDEDALRILRGIRFAAQLNFTIEEHTSQAMLQKKELLNQISGERIQKELFRCIVSDSSYNLVFQYFQIFSVILPGFKDLTLEPAKLNHTIELLQTSKPTLMNRLCVLFYELNQMNPYFIKTISRDLKFPREIEKNMEIILSAYKKPYDSLLAVKRLVHDHRSLALEILQFKKDLDPSFDFEQAYRYYNDIVVLNLCVSLDQLSLRGNDLVEMGFEGKTISDILEDCLEHVMVESLDNDYFALRTYVKSHWQKNQ